MNFTFFFSLAFVVTSAALAQSSRVPWTTSRIQGSPEPPKPFVAEQVFTGVTFTNALDMVPVPALGQWVVAENGGKIWALPNDPQTKQATVALDLKALHPKVDHAYGIAFHPKFAANKQVFVTYTNGDKLDDGSRLSRFTVAQERPLVIDPASEEVLLTWRSGGHNGAAVAFGNDGLLYLSTGDSEVPAPPDPLNTGQDLTDLLSCVLRIDVDRKDAGKAYAVPKDNPFVSHANTPASRADTPASNADTPVRIQKPNGEGAAKANPDESVRVTARPEIWCYGLRNPWKMSFDRPTGNLWCGDVGWEQWEQIFLLKRGENYGWSAMEGNNPILPGRKGPTPISPPIVTHSHTEAASITGGFVYHGKRLPELEGAYIYGDYETGKIWALWHDGKQITRHDEIADTAAKIVSFAQGEDGEVLFIHYGTPATVHRLMRNPHTAITTTFPRRLSETGLFADVAMQTPAAGVQPFEIRAPMWADEAVGQRFIGIVGSGGAATKLSANKTKRRLDAKVTWPKDTVLAKTLRMRMHHEAATSERKIETQVLHYDGESWNAYSYRWNNDETDAELVGPNGDERTLDLTGKNFPGGKHRHTWRFHSRGECMRCHNSWNQFALGLQPPQLTDESARTLTALGLIDADYTKKSAARLSDPHSENLSSEARARSWLHANCAHCHRENGGGSVALMLNAELAQDEMRALNEKPLRGDFGMSDARVILPGSPWKSVLLHRIATSGAGHMPAVGARDVDGHAIGFLAEWILSMATVPPPAQPNPLTSLASPDRALGFLILRDMLEAEDFAEAAELAASSPNAHIRGLFERFLPDDKRVETLGPLATAQKISARRGDAKRGAELFSPTGKAATCLACHFLNGSGRDFGPELSQVGARLTKPQIIESLIAPSKIITQGFQPVVVTLNDGSVQTGFVVKRDDETLSLKIATGQTLPLKKADVKTEQTMPMSLMPEGQLHSLTAQEAADLVEYLAERK